MTVRSIGPGVPHVARELEPAPTNPVRELGNRGFVR